VITTAVKLHVKNCFIFKENSAEYVNMLFECTLLTRSATVQNSITCGQMVYRTTITSHFKIMKTATMLIHYRS